MRWYDKRCLKFFLTGIIICSFNNGSLEKWANATINIMVSAQFFAVFSFFGGISRDFAEIPEFHGFQPCEISEALNKLFQKICKLCSKPIFTRKGENTERKRYTQLYSLWLYLNANWYLSRHCRLTIIFLWAFIPIILDFLDQQESSRLPRVVTKLTQVAKAAFI